VHSAWLKTAVLRIRDPVPFLTPGSGNRDSGCVKHQDRDPRYGSGMNIPDHISESLETILKFFDPDPGIFLTLDLDSGMEKIRIQDPG
jgi:hypothetical protein